MNVKCKCGSSEYRRVLCGGGRRRMYCVSCWKPMQGARLPDRTERHIWVGMISRCHHKTHQSYGYYGARGIRVCKKWRKSFDEFLRDMGPRPGPEYSIDRKDNDKGYCPMNCRWATRKEQASNRRNTVWLIMDGEKTSLSDVCLRTGLSQYRALKEFRRA